MFQDNSPTQRRGLKDVKTAERLRHSVEPAQGLAARQQQRILDAQRMQVPHQQRRLLPRCKIEVNRAPVESGFENFFRRLVITQKFSEQPPVIVEGFHTVEKVKPLFQTLVMQECFLFQSGQDHSDSLAIIESGLSKIYANNIMKEA